MTFKPYYQMLMSGLVGFLSLNCSAVLASTSPSPSSYVNPFIGTSNFGATHPGAQYPHGMASITPFNVAFKAGKENKFEKDESWNSRAYVADNGFLTGFSNVNLSGVGCPELGSILLMPTTGKRILSPERNGSTYHNERASPGYYSVYLDKHNVKVELTSTSRTTLSKFHFPQGKANVILNLGLGLTNETGASIKRVSATEVEGFKTFGTFCYHPEDVRPVYFVARISTPPMESGIYKKMPEYRNVEADWMKFNDQYKPYPSYPHPMAGEDIGAYFSYEFPAATEVQIKVGISYVSIENARQNLDSEQPDFNFSDIRKRADAAWNSLLGRVEVTGTELQKTLFYTAVYHMLIHPTVISDVNGDYPQMEHTGIGNSANTDRPRYSIFSLWDTHRNLHPFLSLVYPELQSDMVNSMVDMAKESGWLPKWELVGMETDVMVGDPATVVVADTYLRGIRDFDVKVAYEFAKKASNTNQSNPLRKNNTDYNKLGYVPVDEEGMWEGSVSTSLEYYIADWNLAQLSKALGDQKAYLHYLSKSKGYKKLFDSTTGMLRPKLRNGLWLTPYDPELGRNFEPAPGYVEGNAWNYRFYVPHDMPGLIEMLGGGSAFLEELDKTFATDNFDMTNEPDITYPYLYHFVPGQHARSSERVDQLIKQHYTNTPGGIPGNDDAGTLSAWLAFSMLGIYPVTPGDTQFALITPQFDEVKIHLSDEYYSGNTFVIKRGAETSDNKNSFHYNDESLSSPFIDHKQIVQGGTLTVRPPKPN